MCNFRGLLTKIFSLKKEAKKKFPSCRTPHGVGGVHEKFFFKKGG